MLDPTPTWTRIDDTDNLVARIEIRRGRQSEFDRTDPGTATIFLNDKAGLFDPNNSGSPYFGKLDGKPIALSVWNPVSDTWVQQFQGFVDDYGYNVHPATDQLGRPILSNIQVECVDMFDYLGRAEVAPGISGTAPPAGSERTVFYEDANANDRVIEALTDAGIDSSMYVVFTMNVTVQESKYTPGDPYLNVIRDAVDAEFPGIANAYVDKKGRFCAHGRDARFDPDGVSAGATPGAWPFMRWKAGDGQAIADDSGNAQIRALAFNRPRAQIINSAFAWPRNTGSRTEQAKMPGQVVVDATSIGKYGIHSWSAPDLIVLAGTTTGNDKWAETRLYGAFYVANFATPLTRIQTLTLTGMRPEDPRAAATWGLICGADISDVVALTASYPGGTGIADDFYLEGLTLTITPLNPEFDHVELSLNVSPAAYYTDNVFGS